MRSTVDARAEEYDPFRLERVNNQRDRVGQRLARIAPWDIASDLRVLGRLAVLTFPIERARPRLALVDRHEPLVGRPDEG